MQTDRPDYFALNIFIAFVLSLIPTVIIGMLIPPLSPLNWLLIPFCMICFLLLFAALAICRVGSINDHE